MKRNFIIGLIITFLMATVVCAQTVNRQIYGVATPGLYKYTLSTNTMDSYLLAVPTLSVADTIAGLAATQTFTNKTLTSPTITGPTITGTIAGTPTITTPVIASFYQDAGKTQLMTAPNTGSDTLVTLAATQTLTGKTLTSPKIGTSILDANGAVMFGFNPQTTAVNYLQFLNSPANTNLTINAIGASTNISLSLNAKGTGTFNFQTQVATDDTIVISPYVGGAGYFAGTITSADLLATRTWTFPDATGTISLNCTATKNYGGAAADWTLTTAEAQCGFVTATNANGAVNAILPAAIPGKVYTINNGTGQTLTFKVTGQTGGTVANGKWALYTTFAADVVEVYELP